MTARDRSPRVLITGAKGRVAGPVIERLSRSCHVIPTDLRPASEQDVLSGYREADLMDFPQVVALMEGVDVVVHLAVVAGVNYENRAEPGPTEVDSFDEAVLRVNPTSTYHVFEAARRAGVRRVIYASSLTIQLADLNRPDFRESSYPAPKNLYACTKLFGESLASVYQRQHGMEMISLRIGQPFPVGTKTDEVWRNSLRARSIFVTMEDVGRAVEAGVFADVAGGIFNVVSESDNPRVDLTAARGLGYVPLNRFSAEGLFAREAEGGDWNLISPTVATTEL